MRHIPDAIWARIGMIGAAFFFGFSLGQYRASSAIENEMIDLGSAVAKGFDMVATNQSIIIGLQQRGIAMLCHSEHMADDQCLQPKRIRTSEKPVILFEKRE